jgi:hypothetical protein
MDKENIYAYVRKQEYLYRIGNTKVAKYVTHSLSETVQTIYAYLNSKHISGEQDSLGRDKPFFNIVIAARNIWFRATDVDRKNILIRETSSDHVISAFLATLKLQDWMRKERFGVFLNDWGLTLAGFGSAITKWVTKGDRLIPTVVTWNKIICDTVDFEGNPKIEIFEFTPAQLKERKEYDQDVVDALINSTMIRMNITGELVDVKPDFIKVYEVHGVFPDSYLTGDVADSNSYSQQMHVVSYNKSTKSGKFNNFSLYKGKEARDPYRKDDLIKEDGRTLAIGSVEHLFQSQWMVNHSAKAIKDQLDAASKLILQTSDPAFVGQNALTSIETGQILQHKINEPLTVVPNGSHDTVALSNYMNQWKALGQEINGISEAMAGATPKAGTAWRLQQSILQESQLLFDLMKQNKLLALEDMLVDYVIPHIKNQLNDSKEVVATLEAHNIKKIDSMYVPQEAAKRFNNKVIEHIIKTGQQPPADMTFGNEMQQVQAEQNIGGNTRYFKPSDIKSKTWKTIFEDLEWHVEMISEESHDDNAILDTLNTALQTVLNPGYANNPQAQMIVGRILSQTGKFSPLEISAPATSPLPPVQPSQPTNVAPPNVSARAGVVA